MSLTRVQALGSDHDELVYRRHSSELVGFAAGLVGRADAADVMSAAFLKAITSRSWPNVSNHRAYLYRAVFNQAATWRRRAARQRDAESASTAAATPVTELPALRPEVRAAVDGLSVQQRAVVLLTYWADLTPRATAEHLGISEGSVRRHLARARARLREVLDA